MSDGVLTLAFDRPKARNAVGLATLEALVAALRAADADVDLRAVVLRGYGDGPFSSGFDLTGLPTVDRYDEATAQELHAPIRRAADAIKCCRHPVVAAIRGYALGAGLDLAAHADLRVAADDAHFGLPAARLGFAYPTAGIKRLVWTLGPAATEALLLEARSFSSAEMFALGFLHRAWSPQDFEAELNIYLAELGRRAPLALRALKRSLRRIADSATDAEDEAAEYAAIAECLSSADAREGPAAFRARRPPVFQGQ